MHYYITGDTHGDFSRIAEFCETNGTDTEDVMIILGDAGINYHLDAKDIELKNELSDLPITLFCVHGNIPGIDQSRVDKSTEKWLQQIYDKLDLKDGWYAGHYHVESEEGDIRIMFEDYDEICNGIE